MPFAKDYGIYRQRINICCIFPGASADCRFMVRADGRTEELGNGSSKKKHEAADFWQDERTIFVTPERAGQE